MSPPSAVKGPGKARLEAFSDGVIAIIVTIMVLELKVPREASPNALGPLAPVFLSYGLSFFVVAIMWINHHYMIHSAREVNSRLLWLNMNLLFWMSLIPFVTGWIGEHHLEPLPVAFYGIDLGLCGAAFGLIRIELARQDRHHPELCAQHRRIQVKTIVSTCVYFSAAACAWKSVATSEIIYTVIPLLYFVPDRIVSGE